MKINMEMLKALCDNVVKMAERGELPSRMGLLAQVVAQKPHEGLLAIVQKAALDPAKMDDAELDRLLAQPADAATKGINRFAEAAPLSNGRDAAATVEDEVEDTVAAAELPSDLEDKAWEYDLESLGDIRRIEEIFSEAVRSGLEEELFEEEDVSPQALEMFLSILGTRIGERLFWRSGIRSRSDTLPPLPSSKDFIEFAKRRVGNSTDAVESWRGSTLWRKMAVELFVGILPYNTGAHGWDGDDQNEKVRSSIEHKREWYREIRYMGAQQSEIEEVFYGNIYRDEAHENRMLAAAEFRRFVDAYLMPYTPENKSERLSLLAYSIKELHKGDLFYSRSRFSHAEFMSLIPRFFEERSLEHLVAILQDDDELVARNILYWHAEPGKGWVRNIARMIREEAEGDSAFDFFGHRFFVPVMDVKEKFDGLHAAGVDLGPIRRALRAKFGKVPLGLDFDPDEPVGPAVSGVIREGNPNDSCGGGSDTTCSITDEPMIPEAMGLGMSTMAMSAMLAARVGIAI